MKSKFITFEGSEGCGKSTQSKLLADYLKKKGFKVIFLREPGGTKISEKIREILLDRKNNKMACGCEMLLYMASRSQIVEEIIRPALSCGKIVICDRFLDSTLAYQGYGLGMDIGLIKKVGNFSSQGLKPDLTILLDVPIKKGLGYRANSQDRIEERPLCYHERVRSGYFKLARSQNQRIKVIKVDEDKKVTQAQIRNEVDKILCR